jgi:hypothetical protein
LISKKVADAIGLQVPTLATRIWNTRDATDEGKHNLWTKMNKGESLNSRSIEHAIIIGIHDKLVLKESWTGPFDQEVQFKEKEAISNTNSLLIEGYHRMGVVEKYLLAPMLKELEIFKKLGRENCASKVVEEIKQRILWTAKLIDLGEFSCRTSLITLIHFYVSAGIEMLAEPLRGMVKESLAKNLVIFKKEDSLIEKISNNWDWLLEAEPEDKKLQKRLATWTKTNILVSNKGQRGILQSTELTQALCMLTRTEHFRLNGGFKIDELNQSRTFAASVRVILLALNETDNFVSVCNTSHALLWALLQDVDIT